MDNHYYTPGLVYVPPPPPSHYLQWNQYSTMQQQHPIAAPSLAQSPPWHKSQTNPAVKGEYDGSSFKKADVNIYAVVDSWRSYKNDTTNLQSITAAELNATAPAFQPSFQYKLYESLRSVHDYARYPSYRIDKPYRVSNGSTERQIVGNAQLGKGTKQKQQKTRYITSSEPIANRLRSADQATADHPLPSIEQVDQLSHPAAFNATPVLNKKRNAKSRSRTPQQRQTKSPEAPTTTKEYDAEARQTPERLDAPKKLLVILDLNGTLLYRNRASATKKCYMRPGVTPFVQYLFDNHVVMVYTSATAPSATAMVNSFLHPNYRSKLAAVWARDKLDLTEEQYKSKVQVYKKLDKVWADVAIQQTAPTGTKWDQSNTVLIDDSKLKALAQPHNLLQVPEYDRSCDPDKAKKDDRAKRYKMQQNIVHQLQLKLDELKYQVNVSRLIHKWQLGSISVPCAPGQEISVEETVDQGLSDTKHKQEIQKSLDDRTHLPTPESLDEEDGGTIVVGEETDVRKTAVIVQRSVSPIDESVFRELLRGE